MLGLKTRLGTAIVGGALMAWLAGCGGGGGGNQMTGSGGSNGSGGGGGGAVQPPPGGDYQPLTIGATWTYHVNDKGVLYDKTATIETEEDIGGAKAGTMGIRMHETTPSDGQLTWYQKVGDAVVRHHEQALDRQQMPKSDQWYDPYRLRIDESADHLLAGAKWSFSYTETSTSLTRPTPATQPLNESWTVDAVEDPVTVPAGSWPALKLTHVDPTDNSTKTYWFVRGIGKVREQTSGGHVEQLASFQIPGA